MTKVRWPFEAIKQTSNHPEADTQEQQLADLISGKSVVTPVNLEHAEFMLKVAQNYIVRHQEKMIEILKQ